MSISPNARMHNGQRNLYPNELTYHWNSALRNSPSSVFRMVRSAKSKSILGQLPGRNHVYTLRNTDPLTRVVTEPHLILITNLRESTESPRSPSRYTHLMHLQILRLELKFSKNDAKAKVLRSKSSEKRMSLPPNQGV